MDINAIDTPQKLGKALKEEFAKLGIEIRTRNIKSVRGLEGSWYEISTHRTGHIIPNELRKEFVSLNYKKPFEELNVLTPDNINYGNVQAQSVAMFGRDWKNWLQIVSVSRDSSL